MHGFHGTAWTASYQRRQAILEANEQFNAMAAAASMQPTEAARANAMNVALGLRNRRIDAADRAFGRNLDRSSSTGAA